MNNIFLIATVYFITTPFECRNHCAVDFGKYTFCHCLMNNGFEMVRYLASGPASIILGTIFKEPLIRQVMEKRAVLCYYLSQHLLMDSQVHLLK
jgi:hypothetical protein